MPLRRIARLIGAERKTIRRWPAHGTPAYLAQAAAAQHVDPFSDYLEQRWADGCRNAGQLWREMAERGFPGRPSVVRAWAGRGDGSESYPTRKITDRVITWQSETGDLKGFLSRGTLEAGEFRRGSGTLTHRAYACRLTSYLSFDP